MSQSHKRARSVSPISSHIFKSSPIEDRSSTFVAFYSTTLAAKELQAHSEFKSASHRIAAWRKPCNQRALNAQRLLDTGHDDDGEKYGGKTLEKVLIEMQVEGAVVVARWYGGVMLGPVRFDHIKNSARDAIMQWSQETERLAKKAKVRGDETERERLIQTLPERDQSIVVLRDLLTEKSPQPSSAPESQKSPAKVPDYSTLPLPALEKMGQVRDATIGWILKRIEDAEKAQAEEAGATNTAMPRATETLETPAKVDEHVAKEAKLMTEASESQDTKNAPPEPDKA